MKRMLVRCGTVGEVSKNEKIQKKLNSKGYRWKSGEYIIHMDGGEYCDRLIICCEEDGKMSYSGEEYFFEEEYLEYKEWEVVDFSIIRVMEVE